MEPSERVGAGAVLILGLVVVFFSTRLPYWAEYTPGPGFFPFWIGIGFIGCGLLLSYGRMSPKPHGKSTAFLGPKTWKAALVLMALAAAILLVPVIGLSAGLALFAGFSMRSAGRHSWLLCALVAGATLAGIHMVFGTWLNVPLPKSMLGW